MWFGGKKIHSGDRQTWVHFFDVVDQLYDAR